MNLKTCQHPDTLVIYTDGECLLCQALSDLTNAQHRDSAFVATCAEAVEVLCDSSLDHESNLIGQRLALEMEIVTEEKP